MRQKVFISTGESSLAVVFVGSAVPSVKGRKMYRTDDSCYCSALSVTLHSDDVFPLPKLILLTYRFISDTSFCKEKRWLIWKRVTQAPLQPKHRCFRYAVLLLVIWRKSWFVKHFFCTSISFILNATIFCYYVIS